MIRVAECLRAELRGTELYFFVPEPLRNVARSWRVPRYFLHMRDGPTLVRDDEGSELADLNAARAEALSAAGEILADRIKAGRMLGYRMFEIADHTGVTLTTVPFRMALKLD